MTMPVPASIPALVHVTDDDCVGDCSVAGCHEPAIDRRSRMGRPPTRCEHHSNPGHADYMVRWYNQEPYASTGRGSFRGTRADRLELYRYRDAHRACDSCGFDGRLGGLEIDHDHDCTRHADNRYCLECVRGILCQACNQADKLAGLAPFQAWRKR